MSEFPTVAKFETKEMDCPRCHFVIRIPLFINQLGMEELYIDYGDRTIANMAEVIELQNKTIQTLYSEVQRLQRTAK